MLFARALLAVARAGIAARHSRSFTTRRRKAGTMKSTFAHLLALCVCAALALLVAGCATQEYPPAPKLGPAADYNYHIGPTDVINVIVWRNPELSMSVPVRPDGKITTPLVEDLQALGKTPTELQREMEKALAKYIREPVVTL